MASLEEIREKRIEKLKILKDKGVNPYPINSNITKTCAEVSEDFEKLSGKGNPLTLGGRVMSLRPHGALVFFNLEDGSGKFQGLLKKGETSDEQFELFSSAVDIGDFIEVSGKLFLTQRNEKSLMVSEWRMLTKSLRPLPEKWHGLQDVEERFRKRYLDTLVSPEVKERFVTRSKMITEIRKILDGAGYLEVDTPALQPLAGGASALPFKTHYNALDTDFYLRISPELYLKKLLIGGFSKVYEIARDFRNEGIDVTHSPEFTMLEFYEAYSDSEKQMKFVEKMVRNVAKKSLGKESFNFGENTIDVSKKFAVISYFDLLKRYALVENPENISLEEAKIKAQQLGVKTDAGDGIQKILDNIYKKTCRPKLIQPTFVIDYPADYLPLAKRTEKNPNLVDAFQLVIGNVEIVKAFSELNDPIDQKGRFDEQEKNKAQGDKEAQTNDSEFVEALEYGMPPAGGVGIGIDRLVMLFTNSHNIREVILFPTLKPKSD